MATKEKFKLQKRLSSFNKPAQVNVSGQKSTIQSNVKTGRTKAANFEGRNPKGKTNSQSKPNASKPTYSIEAERMFDRVLEGKLDELPSIPRSTVRIFLSSTFTDMRAERNSLAKNAYPRLREYCTSQGLSFQVVDLRWGVTSEVTNNHLTTKICLTELENCKKVSLGPKCIALIGNRYGFCPLPYEIPVDEFAILKEEAVNLNMEEVKILDDWFIRDDNSCPPMFFLQPVTSRLPNFLNDQIGQEMKKKDDERKWSETERKLINIIHNAARSAATNGKLSTERQNFYTMSVTEHEARCGLMSENGSDHEGVAFFRQLNGLEGERLTDKNANRHKEVCSLGGKIEVDKRIEEKVTSLKKDITKVLRTDLVKQYTVDWQEDGIHPDDVESHRKYIAQFCEDFVSKVRNQIEAGIQENSCLIRQREWYSNYAETLHHAQFCLSKCESFCGQRDVLNKIKNYILDTNNRKPYVIHANSGIGKTSVMAMAMKQLSEWIKGDHYGVIRFLGTSPRSTNIYDVIFNVCGQLADLKETIMEPQSYRTMRKLVQYFPRFLRSVANSLKVPIVIFLDSLDQLESMNDAYSVNWLPSHLPQGVRIIISTLPEEHDILNNLKTVIAEPTNFSEIHPIPFDVGLDIIQKYFGSKNRTLTPDQRSLIMETVKKNASPLYLKLLMDEALTWNSFTHVSDLRLPESVRVAINVLFEKLEIKFGVKCVQGALGLISVGLSGLSEIEIEDALSCLDDALVEIYKYHDPPVEGMIRVPPVLWARIHYDIKEYLVERQSHGVTTLFWYHRQFIEASKERYTVEGKGEKLHKTLFEMYAAENGIKRTIVLTQRQNLEIIDADRDTNPQPLNARNTRKLESMTFHLQNCTEIIDRNCMKRTTYCCFGFIQAKIASIGAVKLLEEMQAFLKLRHDQEVKKMTGFVSMFGNSLKDSTIFAFRALAYIQPESGEDNLNFLKSRAIEFLTNQSKTCLIPCFPGLARRCGEPEKVYDGLSRMIAQCNEMCLFIDNDDLDKEFQFLPKDSTSTTLSCVDLTTFDMDKYVCEDMTSQPFLSFDGKTIFYLSESEMELIKLNISDGKKTNKPLVELFSPKIKSSSGCISQGNCCLSGSLDSKMAAIAIGSKFCVFNANDFKSFFHHDGQADTNIFDLQISRDNQVTYVFSLSNCENSDGDSETKTLLQVWKAPESKPIIHEIFFMRIGQSAISYDNGYFICYGTTKSNKSVVKLVDIKSPLKLNTFEMNGKIMTMKLCPSDPMAVLQVGDVNIQVLDLSSSQFIKDLKHSEKIKAWSMNWEEDEMVVLGETDGFCVYNSYLEIVLTQMGNSESVTVTNFTVAQNQMIILTADKKAKCWGLKDLFETFTDNDKDRRTLKEPRESLNSQDAILSFVLTQDTSHVITAGVDHHCSVWSLNDFSLIKRFDICNAASKMLLGNDNKIIALDQLLKSVVVFDWKEGKVICSDLPPNVMDMVLTKDKNYIYLVALDSKPVLYQYDLKSNSTTKKCTIRINFECVSAEIYLTHSERYAAFLMQHTPADFQAIQVMKGKQGKFPAENYNKRFVAVDISQNSGTAFYALYNLAKIPHLGVTMEPYFGNQMMLSTRRWVMYWDIPTGKCDQRLSKSTRMTKMYRPLWLGQQCVGNNNVLAMSPNHKFVAVGSQDGYVFIYDAENGMPASQEAPSTRHSSPVNLVTISHLSDLVGSACTGGHIKLWQPSTGNCLFSISVGAKLKQINFSKCSNKFVAITSGDHSRLLVFDVHKG